MTKTKPTHYDLLGRSVLEWIQLYIQQHGYSPSTREISQAHGFSKSQACNILDRMRQEGLVTYVPHAPRTVRPTGATMVELQEGM